MSYDLAIEQGATFRAVFAWQDAAGVAINASGYSAHLQVRKDRSSTTTILSLTSVTTAPDWAANAKLTVTGLTGEIAVYIGATVTAALTENGYYDLELHSLTDPDEVVRLVAGRTTVSRQITQP